MTQGLEITYERQFEREAKTSKEKVANPSSSTCNFQAYNNDAITITNTTNTTTRYKCRVKPKYCATDSRRTKPRTGKKDMKSRLHHAFPLQSEKKDGKEREIQRSMQPRQSVLHCSKKKRENQKKKKEYSNRQFCALDSSCSCSFDSSPLCPVVFHPNSSPISRLLVLSYF